MVNGLTVISFVLIILGIVGIFAPVLPGPILVLIGIVLYGFATDFAVITFHWIILFALLTFITIVVDYLASFFTAKRYKVSAWGMTGMFLGGFAGLILLNVIGLLIGQVLGLVLGEVLSGKELMQALKAGSAGVVGYIISLIVKVILTLVMVISFLYLIY